MLTVSHVTKRYGKNTACGDVSFHLERGGVTVLLDGKLLEGSVRGRLDTLREYLDRKTL